MCRFLAFIAALAMISFAGGCATCDSPFDGHYTATGGSIQRADRDSGRVNSAFVPTTSDQPADEGSPPATTNPAADVNPTPPSSFPLLDEREVLYYGLPVPR